MNAISNILLYIVILAFFTVAYYLYRGGGKKSCCKDCKGCGYSNSCNGCSR